MDNALIFIIQRFYFSFASGSIINFYIIYAVFVLERTGLLPKWFLSLKDIEFSHSALVWIFILSALLIGMFIIMGFVEGGGLSYIENRKKYLKQGEDHLIQNDSENECDKLNCIGKCMYFLFMKSTIFQEDMFVN